VKCLLEADFDRDAQTEIEMTALAISVQQGELSVIELLLQKGAVDLPNERKKSRFGLYCDPMS
jgi:hypothetical protein